MTTTDDLMRAFGRLEQKVDTTLEQASSHAGRIGSLERTRSYGYGVAAALTAVVGWVFQR